MTSDGCDVCFLTKNNTVIYLKPFCMSVSVNWYRSLERHVFRTVTGNHLVGAGNSAAAPPPFRPGDPALCGSCLLVTPYYCRLGDLPCFVFLSAYCMFDLSVLFVPLVLWYCWLGLLTCKNRLPYNLYSVGGVVKHCSIHPEGETPVVGPVEFQLRLKTLSLAFY